MRRDERRHPPRRHRDASCCSSGSSRSSPTSRSCAADSLAERPAQRRASSSRDIRRAARPDRHGRRRRRSRSRCRPTTSSSTSACTRPRPRRCSRTSSATSRSSSARSASRRRTRPSSPAATFQLHDQQPRRHRSRQRQPAARSCSRCREGAAGRPRPRSHGQRGSVVVLDVQTGGVVAVYSNPTFDPNLLASHDAKSGAGAYVPARRDPTTRCSPARGASSIPPGSTFKTVTASIALDRTTSTSTSSFPSSTEHPAAADERRRCSNFGGERCGGSLATSFIESCNTTFGQVGLDLGETVRDGHPAVRRAAPQPPADPTSTRRSSRASDPTPGTFQHNQPTFAQAAIGQGTGRGHAARDGARRRVGRERRRDPRAARRRLRRGPDGNGRGATFEPKEWRRAMDPATAATLTRVHARRSSTTAAPAPRADPGRPGRGQDRHRGDARRRAAARVVHRVRAGRRTRSTRSRCSSSTAASRRDAEATGGRVAAPIAAQVLADVAAAP